MTAGAEASRAPRSSRRTARARGVITRWPSRSRRAASTSRWWTSSRRSSPRTAARPTDGFDVGLLLPHLGFAYQELGQPDKAIASFEEARALAPDDPAIAGYLIDANISAKRYDAAVAAAKSALAQKPNDLRLTRLQAQALRQGGKPEEGIALPEDAVTHHADDPAIRN